MNESLEVIIRVAEPSDAQGIVSLCQKIGNETPFLTFGSEGINLSIQQEADLIMKYQQSCSSLLVVAELDSEIIAMANITEFQPVKQNHIAEIGVCVLQAYQEMGLATQLLEMLLEFADNSELKVITLEVAIENAPAIHLYQKLGFRMVGILSKRLRVNNVYLDSFLMEKVLE